MAIRICSSCERDTLEGKNEMYCFHQREVLLNPYYTFRESIRARDKQIIKFFTELKDFILPNIL